MTYESIPCPKCKATLAACGEITFLGEVLPVYQCENEACMVKRDIFHDGNWLDLYYTFYLNADGVPVDATDPNTELT